MSPRGMSHVALCTNDFERSMHFYRDLLGFKVAQEGTTVEEGEYQQGIYKKKNQQVKFAILRHGKKKATPYGLSEDAPVIALLAPTQSKATGKPILVDQIGISHFGIWVKGLNRVHKDLERKGVEFVAPPHVLAKTKEGTIRSAFVKDPDGIIIQLDEMIPARV